MTIQQSLSSQINFAMFACAHHLLSSLSPGFITVDDGSGNPAANDDNTGRKRDLLMLLHDQAMVFVTWKTDRRTRTNTKNK